MHEKIILKRDSNGLNCSLKNLSRNQVCSFYKHEDELKESIIPFIFKSLELNRKVIFIAKGHMNETVLSYCSKLNNKINTYIQNSQFNLITINASDLKDDKFFPQGIINLIMRECKDAETLEFSEALIIQDIPYIHEHISVIDRLTEYESVLNQRLQNFKYTSISLFNTEIFGFGLLNSIIDLYPSCHINSEIYTNSFYIPPKHHISKDKHFNIFNFKLEKLNQDKSYEKALLFNQYIEIRRYLYKVAHDLKAPIRTAHIMNNMLHESERLDLSENKELLLIMSKSLIQAYEQINAFEEMIKTFGNDAS